MNAGMQSAVEQHLLQAAQAMEAQVDAELQNLEKLDDDGLEAIRQRRIMAMKKEQEQRKEWSQNGHGRFEELKDEKEFFEACKKSKFVVCHFYRDEAIRCKILDKHLKKLSQKHMGTRFVSLNAEKSPFLCERLRIVVIPTLCIAKEGKTTDYIVGFDELGGRDDFSTEMLEWRLAVAGVADYNGDITSPPDQGQAKKKAGPRKTIRGHDGDDSDDDW